MKDDVVTITCYGSTEQYTRKKAMAFFAEAMAASEGHEHERYEYIYECLCSGYRVISDENV
jgi:hypothetical protein